MSQEPQTAPAWLLYGVPAAIILGGIYSIVTRTFFIAGGAKSRGTSGLTGMPAVWAGLVMVALGLGLFFLFRLIDRRRSSR